jgi:hypothetical protein
MLRTSEKGYFFDFVIDVKHCHMIHCIYINLEENILSGQFDSFGSTAGNAVIALMPDNGSWRI